jgi:hypothetical protein
MTTEAPSEVQIIQDAANLGVLARQAIANEFPTMEVDPKICANVALLVDRLRQTTDEAPAPEDAPDPDASARLEHSKEEGRREMIGEFAQEKADLLQRISELETAPPEGHEMKPLPPEHPGQPVFPHPSFPDGNAASDGGNEFKGPGQ